MGSLAPLWPLFVIVSTASVAKFRVFFAILIYSDYMDQARKAAVPQRQKECVAKGGGCKGETSKLLLSLSCHYYIIVVVVVVIITRDIQKK